MIFRLPWLPSANRIWVTGRGVTYLSRQYKAALRESQILWLEQGRPRVAGLVEVYLYLYPPDRRSVDVDNRIKPALDTLTKIGFWSDDDCVQHVQATLCDPVENGAIIAEVYAFDETRKPSHEAYGLKAKTKKKLSRKKE